MFRRSATAVIGLALTLAALVPAANAAERGLTYNVPAASGSVQRVSDITSASRIALPDLVISDGSNLPVHVSRYRGYVVVLNFYSVNCGPCIKDLLYLNRLQGNMKGFPIQVVPISEDGLPPKTVKDFLSKQSFGFLKPFGDPSNGAATALGVSGMPSTVIVDKAGRLAGAVAGNVVWDSPDVQNALMKLTRE
ncbi:MAG TPA: TlpA disulfide reductase family protein [Candidatus Sulfotelmatobacter sp.]|jgi:peroxiredoxin|nr:TlpA disulfide reductase family protein [Candidatus Sulfotelmatobacter sp.]